nr:immunoglobulin heavy chain junction region [Macaca mulatta]
CIRWAPGLLRYFEFW